MPTWPASLPSPLQDGYAEILDDVTIASPMDVGPPKVRKRVTKAIDERTFTLQLTAAQKSTLDVFYRTTVEGGALTFDWTDPDDSATKTARFKPGQRLVFERVRSMPTAKLWRASVALLLV